VAEGSRGSVAGFAAAASHPQSLFLVSVAARMLCSGPASLALFDFHWLLRSGTAVWWWRGGRVLSWSIRTFALLSEFLRIYLERFKVPISQAVQAANWKVLSTGEGGFQDGAPFDPWVIQLTSMP